MAKKNRLEKIAAHLSFQNGTSYFLWTGDNPVFSMLHNGDIISSQRVREVGALLRVRPPTAIMSEDHL